MPLVRGVCGLVRLCRVFVVASAAAQMRERYALGFEHALDRGVADRVLAAHLVAEPCGDALSAPLLVAADAEDRFLDFGRDAVR